MVSEHQLMVGGLNGSAQAGDDILTMLNPEQRKIVSAPPGNMLVLAGAGSGKTRVLTSRIAWLCRTHDFNPSRIVAVTFTLSLIHI